MRARAEDAGGLLNPPGNIEFDGSNLFRTVHHSFTRWRFTRAEVADAGDMRGVIELEIDLGSVETGDEKLNRRARSPQFFDVSKYPTATLRILNARRLAAVDEDAERYCADLDVDLHGVLHRQPIEFEVVSESPLKVTGNLTLSRTAFGIGRAYHWINPFSIQDDIRIRFEAIVPREDKQ